MIDLPASQLGELQRAARALLRYGLITEQHPGAETWRLVRRYAEPLDSALSELVGYRVVVGRTAVRLARRLDRLPPGPVFTTPSGRPFDPFRYALVALSLAALERSGSQTTLSELARRVRQGAERLPALSFDPADHVARLALSHAVRALESLGALRVADGSREAWERGDSEGEVLYDIDRALCRQVFPLPRGLNAERTAVFLHRDPVDAGRDTLRRARRQRLSRALLERPVLYLDELDAADRAFLQREGSALLADLERLTGGQGERRAEGLALLDPGRSLSDRPFPRSGGEAQAALLLATRLCARAAEAGQITAPHPAEEAASQVQRLTGDERPSPPVEGVPRPFLPRAVLEEEARAVQAAAGGGLRADHREDATALLRDALGVLAELDLVRPVEGGVVLTPALARYREIKVQVEPAVQAQLGLFGGAP